MNIKEQIEWLETWLAMTIRSIPDIDDAALKPQKAILSTLRAIESAELPSEPQRYVTGSHGVISTCDTGNLVRYAAYAELRTAAESLALKLSDAERQDEETRKLLSAERKRVKVLEDALRRLVELKQIKRRIEAGTASDVDARFYESAKEDAWLRADEALKGARV